MRKSILFKTIYRSESLKITDFCLEKFNLKDPFQLNDKFEGRKFLENSLKNYMINKMLFEEVLGNRKIKLEKLIKFNNKKLFDKVGLSSITVSNIIEVENYIKKYDVVIFANADSLRVSLFSDKDNVLKSLNNIESYVKV